MKRTGSIEPHRDASGRTRYRARIWLSDGYRARVPLADAIAYSTTLAKEKAVELQAEEDRTGILFAARKKLLEEAARARGEVVDEETADEWFERYLPTVECGENHRGKLGTNWSKWISPVIGPKTMRALTRDDVEDVRDALDRAIDAGTLRSKTALNIWSTLTAALKAASSARDRRLRVHATPLHFAILPPKRGESRQRPWIYPNEWRLLAKCKDVPAEWRRTYAIALYTVLEPSPMNGSKTSPKAPSGARAGRSRSSAWPRRSAIVSARRIAFASGLAAPPPPQPRKRFGDGGSAERPPGALATALATEP